MQPAESGPKMRRLGHRSFCARTKVLLEKKLFKIVARKLKIQVGRKICLITKLKSKGYGIFRKKTTI